jgi:hypothetical protein
MLSANCQVLLWDGSTFGKLTWPICFGNVTQPAAMCHLQ